jgi:hypothetical protein
MTKFRTFIAIATILATLAGMAVHPAQATATEPILSVAPSFSWCLAGALQTNVKFTPKGVFSFTSGALAEMKKYGAQDCQVCFGGREVTYSFTSPAGLTLLPDGKKIQPGGQILTTGYFHFSLPPGDYSQFNLTVLIVADYTDPRISISPQQWGTYYPETGHNVPPIFQKYWATHGLDLGDPGVSWRESLALFGYPLTEPFWENLEGQGLFEVQYFERARFEYHPENADPQYQVLLGQQGRTVAQMRTISIAPAAVGRDHTCDYDQATSHNLCGTFRTYWQANGALAQFGHPLTEQFTEKLEDGKTYEVQYFERTRLELHPENVKPYNIELGQFSPILLDAMLALRQIQPR